MAKLAVNGASSSETLFKSLVFLDLEATSLSSLQNGVRVTELGLVAVQYDHFMTYVPTPEKPLPRVLNRSLLCFNPMKMIMPRATEISGLDNDLLEMQSTFSDDDAHSILHFVTRLPQPVCLVAHNGLRFDFKLLKAELRRRNTRLPASVYCVDTLLAFREILGFVESTETENDLQNNPMPGPSTAANSISHDCDIQPLNCAAAVPDNQKEQDEIAACMLFCQSQDFPSAEEVNEDIRTLSNVTCVPNNLVLPSTSRLSGTPILRAKQEQGKDIFNDSTDEEDASDETATPVKQEPIVVIDFDDSYTQDALDIGSSSMIEATNHVTNESGDHEELLLLSQLLEGDEDAINAEVEFCVSTSGSKNEFRLNQGLTGTTPKTPSSSTGIPRVGFSTPPNRTVPQNRLGAGAKRVAMVTPPSVRRDVSQSVAKSARRGLQYYEDSRSNVQIRPNSGNLLNGANTPNSNSMPSGSRVNGTLNGNRPNIGIVPNGVVTPNGVDPLNGEITSNNGNATKRRQSFTLGDIYTHLFHRPPKNAHAADADAEMLLEACLNMRQQFSEWAIRNCQTFESIQSLW